MHTLAVSEHSSQGHSPRTNPFPLPRLIITIECHRYDRLHRQSSRRVLVSSGRRESGDMLGGALYVRAGHLELIKYTQWYEYRIRVY